MSYSVEVDPSGRAKCKDPKCKMGCKMEKGAPRICNTVAGGYGKGRGKGKGGYVTRKYYHPKCCFAMLTRKRSRKDSDLTRLHQLKVSGNVDYVRTHPTRVRLHFSFIMPVFFRRISKAYPSNTRRKLQRHFICLSMVAMIATTQMMKCNAAATGVILMQGPPKSEGRPVAKRWTAVKKEGLAKP